MSQAVQPGAPAAAAGLKRELKTTDAAAFSVGLIGPVGGMALLGAGAALRIGGAATLAFVFAVVGVGLVAYGFVKLSQDIAHTGSVYALVGITLGPRAGFAAGWALLGAYIGIAVGSSIEFGLFAGNVLRGIGWTHSQSWFWWTLIAIAVVAALSFSEIRIITRSLLVSELIGAVLVAVLAVIILARVIGHHAPSGFAQQTHFLTLPSGSGLGTIGGAAVFGFLAFAGFEGAAALGEETENPKRDIPKALKVAIAIVSVFFLLVIISQSVGYGTTASEVKQFANSTSPYGDLGTAYVGSWFADLLNLVAAISLFAILLGTVAASARILYALGRDAGPVGQKAGLTRLTGGGAPITALVIALAVVLVTDIVEQAEGTEVLNATFYALTIGTISLLVAYALATLGALRFLFTGDVRRAPRWQIIVPVLAFLFVIYTIYKNIVGQVFPYNKFSYVVGIWLAVGLLLVLLTPGLARRVREGLALSGDQDEPQPEKSLTTSGVSGVDLGP